jgi:hypothetical protein
MEEKEIGIDESLKIIRQMVNAGETRINVRGLHFIVAGSLISIASFINAIFMKQLNEDYIGGIWLTTILLIGMFSLFYEVKYFRGVGTESMFDKIFLQIILAFVFLIIGTMSLGMCFLQSNPTPVIILELTAFYSIVSILFKISGLMSKASLAPFYLLALFAAKGSAERSLFILSAISVFTLVLPGIILYRKSINKPLFK